MGFTSPMDWQGFALLKVREGISYCEYGLTQRGLQRYADPLVLVMDSDKQISTSFSCSSDVGPILPLALIGMLLCRRPA
jgi:hypothetical protein